jgi:hypothetical protein
MKATSNRLLVVPGCSRPEKVRIERPCGAMRRLRNVAKNGRKHAKFKTLNANLMMSISQ